MSETATTIPAAAAIRTCRGSRAGRMATASISASPDKVFPLINDFNRWPLWSPYEKKDPAMKRVLTGTPSGKGSVYEWEGNSKIGKGRIEITDASPPSRVTIKLDMIKPMEGHNIVDFTLEPRGGGTHVTWAMRGSCAYMAKVMGLFLNMDKMVGKDFEVGLANLKAAAERSEGN